MTKAQKSLFKSLKKKKQRAEFIAALREQQARLGGYDAWPKAYLRRCRKKDAEDILVKLSEVTA